MDLSGQLIRGTGSYEVKEVAPPVESGQLIDQSLWLTAGYWNAVGACWTTDGSKWTANGNAGFLTLYNAWTVGRNYKIKIRISELNSGSLAGPYDGSGYSLTMNTVGVYTYYYSPDGAAHLYIYSTNFDGSFDILDVEEVPEGYPLLDKGDKYLECTSAGVAAIPCNIAFGIWEFDCYQEGLPQIFFIQNSITNGNAQGYNLFLNANQGIQLQRKGIANDFVTANNYIDTNTWYRFKITRTLDGEFTVYIRGGAFGNDDWTLVSVTGGSGTNPVTDTSYTESQYFVLDFDSGDRIANLEIRNLVRQ